MAVLTIDQQIEAAKAVIRNGGKLQPGETVCPGLLADLFGPETDATRLENAIDRLVRAVMMRSDNSASPDSYDRL